MACFAFVCMKTSCITHVSGKLIPNNQNAKWRRRFKMTDNLDESGSPITIHSSVDDLRGYFTPLYAMGHGQIMPDEAFICLDPKGCVHADSRSKTGGVSGDTYFGRNTEWTVDPRLDGDDLADTLNHPETLKLFERVFNGHEISSQYEGSRGSLDDDAQEAFNELQEVFDGMSKWYVMDAGELIVDAESDLTKAGDLATAVSNISDTLQDSGADGEFLGTHIIGGDESIEKFLKEWIEENEFEFPVKSEKKSAAATM